MNSASMEQHITERPNFRRKKYVINPSFQWKYAAMMAVIVFLLTSLMSSVLYGMLHQQARMRLINPTTYSSQVGMVIVFAALAFSVITAGGVGLWSMLFTHRMCGPLFVLDGYLHELADGKIPNPRNLRRKDEFKELYATFSSAVAHIRHEKEEQVASLTQALARMKSALDSDEAACKRTMQSVACQLEQMRVMASEALGVETVAAPATESAEQCEPERTPVAVG